MNLFGGWRNFIDYMNGLPCSDSDRAFAVKGWEKHRLAKESARADRLQRQLAEARAELGETPGLNAAEIERLAWLMEECGEVAHAVGKVLRFGWNSRPPNGGPTNRVYLERELGNVCSALEYMIGAGDVRGGDVRHYARRKSDTVSRWLVNQGEACGSSSQGKEDEDDEGANV